MTMTRKAKNAPTSTSGVRQQPVGTNHFQFRLHQPAGWGGGAGVKGGGGGGGVGSMPVYFLLLLWSRDFFVSPVLLHCARKNRPLPSPLMTSKLLLAVLSAILLAAVPGRAADDTVLLNTLGYT